MADKLVTEGILVSMPVYLMTQPGPSVGHAVLVVGGDDGAYASLACLIGGTLEGWPCHVGRHIDDMAYSFGRVRITIERLDARADSSDATV